MTIKDKYVSGILYIEWIDIKPCSDILYGIRTWLISNANKFVVENCIAIGRFFHNDVYPAAIMSCTKGKLKLIHQPTWPWKWVEDKFTKVLQYRDH